MALVRRAGHARQHGAILAILRALGRKVERVNVHLLRAQRSDHHTGVQPPAQEGGRRPVVPLANADRCHERIVGGPAERRLIAHRARNVLPAPVLRAGHARGGELHHLARLEQRDVRIARLRPEAEAERHALGKPIKVDRLPELRQLLEQPDGARIHHGVTIRPHVQRPDAELVRRDDQATAAAIIVGQGEHTARAGQPDVVPRLKDCVQGHRIGLASATRRVCCRHNRLARNKGCSAAIVDERVLLKRTDIDLHQQRNVVPHDFQMIGHIARHVPSHRGQKVVRTLESSSAAECAGEQCHLDSFLGGRCRGLMIVRSNASFRDDWRGSMSRILSTG